MRTIDDAIDAFLDAVFTQDVDTVRGVLSTHPDLAQHSLHVAATLGLPDEAARLIAAEPASVHLKRGQQPATPLLFLCFSPFHGESTARDAGLLETARVLLAAGADPNTTDARHNVPALYAVTGERSVPPIARLLLAAGANPTDGESLHHAAQHNHVDALELLVSAGGDVNQTGEVGNTPLYFLLRWWDLSRDDDVRKGVTWLLGHGANPNVRNADEQETSLHVAAWRGQALSIIQLLLDHGADVHATRGDGRSAWLLASRNGFSEIASLLEQAGARPEAMTLVDQLVAACGRADIDDARRLATPDVLATLGDSDKQLIVEAASTGRWPTVLACIAAGFDVNMRDASQSTALHHASISGQAHVVRALLAVGADVHPRDRNHSSTPLGWATFGSDFVNDATGDYPTCVRMLLAAGAHAQPDEYSPRRADVRAALSGA